MHKKASEDLYKITNIGYLWLIDDFVPYSILYCIVCIFYTELVVLQQKLH